VEKSSNHTLYIVMQQLIKKTLTYQDIFSKLHEIVHRYTLHNNDYPPVFNVHY